MHDQMHDLSPVFVTEIPESKIITIFSKILLKS